ncbi:hypothetical protein CHLNCDRAFT_143471 [Chlorella variabilis]|uniref:Uncharacterized protein n=1 Tax=Chlorella variabilis TaxID=554065 RepID=E1ZAZ6_CHLVA|nr:hypothetical protein CHLNCDRAFT_143471 [Chlorella variabilis]EFN57139.1 hypothetical protein CHLNCDRAFT_143471 [Chlorella variabilis]|eukprot:XP_005849241.1 hypothetical protein CHLNCDRAFT_143471 [Chlorella variabilis]
MRTVVRGDNKLPVYINNKDVMNLIVVNESKLRRDSVLPKLPLITATLTLRYRDVDLLAHIEKDITEYLSSHPDVDQAITARCVLADFTTTGPQLALRALLRRQVAPRQAFVLSELLRGAEQIVRAHGGYLAIEELYSHDLPPSPPPAMAATVTRALTNGGGGGGGTAGSPPLPSSFSSSQSTDSV